MLFSHAEVRDRAVREDVQRLRAESESYSGMMQRAEQNWRRLQTGTQTADQLLQTHRSELNAALSELTSNRGATDELYGRFATLQEAQANANAECNWLKAELGTERRCESSLDTSLDADAGGERLAALARHFDEFKATVEHKLSDAQGCVEGYRGTRWESWGAV